MRALEREIVALQDLAASTGEAEHIKVLKRKKSALSDLLGFSAQGALVRSRFQYVAKMDAPSHFVFGLEWKNGQKKTHAFPAVRHWAAAAGVAFYKELFKEEFQERPEVAQSFYEGLPKVPMEAKAELDAQISADELAAALQSLDSGKAPGIDGLPPNKAFWPVIGQDLLLVLRDSFNKGRLPLSCKRAVLTLLPKKGIYSK